MKKTQARCERGDGQVPADYGGEFSSGDASALTPQGAVQPISCFHFNGFRSEYNVHSIFCTGLLRGAWYFMVNHG